MRSNGDIDWNGFNADTYRRHYFDNVGKEDWWIVQETLRLLKGSKSSDAPLDHMADIGAGPSILAGLACVPFARRVELIDPGAKNIDYLASLLSNPEKLWSDWGAVVQKIHEEAVAVEGHRKANELLAVRGSVRQARVADLDKEAYDIITSLYCAESATESKEECAEMIQKILKSLKKGGSHIAAYMEHSKGYPDQSFDTLSGEVEAKKFPSADISEAWLKRQFKGTNIQVKRCPFEPAMRAGYTGVLLAIGTK